MTHTHADGTVHEGEHHTETEDQFPQSTATIEDVGSTKKRIKLEIPGERIKGKLDEAFGELTRDAVLPGFRRGRAPKRLLEKRFGGDLRNTVKQQVVAEAYQKAIEDNKIDALGEPDVNLSKVELPESGALTLTVEVEVTPEFALPSLEGIAVKKPILEANDERLNLAIDNLRRHFGHWHTVTDGAAADDTVTADVKVTLDNAETPIVEESGVQLTVKAGTIAGVKFDNLGDELKGKKASDVVTLNGTVPEDAPQEDRRGKSITVQLTIKDVRRQNLPEVNEEFAQMLGFETLEQLKNDLRERLVVQLAQEAETAQAQQVYRYLLTNTQLEVPMNLSQRQMGNVFRRRATELLNKGVPEQEIVAHMDQLRISSAQQAQVDLKLFFILSKLATQFNIDVSEAEVNAKIAQIAEQYGRRPEKLKSQMSGNGQLEQLYLQVRDAKVVSKILETATVSDVDEKTLAEEFKNLPPVTGINVSGVSSNVQSGS
jgi:trigger factor